MASPSLRIAVISYYLPSASKIGVGHQVHELANELVRRGHRVDVFSECPPVDGALYTLRQIVLTGSLRTFRFAWRLRSVDFSGYDVLHAHTDDYWLWRSRGPVHIRTMHGSCFEEALRIRGVKERLRMVLLGFSEVMAALVADRTVLVSPATRRWMPWVKQVIPNGVDTSRFRPDATQRSATPVILFVGTWHGRKRGAALAAAFVEHVRPAMPDAELWMVTRDSPKNLPAGIRVLGALSDSELALVYQQAWVFCLPSAYEGFGIPYAEALASGLPVVATPNVGARYVTDGGRVAVLSQLDAVGPALSAILQDSDRRQALASAGIARADKFSLKVVVDAYEDLYRAQISSAGQRPTARGLAPGVGPLASKEVTGGRKWSRDGRPAAGLSRPGQDIRGSGSIAPAELKVGAYVLAADPWWVENSILAYYDRVDHIVVSYDADHISWTGTELPVQECLDRIGAIDTEKKCIYAPGHYARLDHTPLANETFQRQRALDQASKGVDWVLQLDTDEVMVNPAVFFDCLAEAHSRATRAMEFPSRYLYSRAGDGRYLEASTRWWRLRSNYPAPMAVRSDSVLVYCRQLAAPTFRVDFRANNTEPRRPYDEVVHRVVAPEEGILHYSWIRDDEYMRRKAAWSGHTDEYSEPTWLRRWRWRSERPALAVAATPFMPDDRRFRRISLPGPFNVQIDRRSPAQSERPATTS